jgi:hypothetical protein
VEISAEKDKDACRGRQTFVMVVEDVIGIVFN